MSWVHQTTLECQRTDSECGENLRFTGKIFHDLNPTVLKSANGDFQNFSIFEKFMFELCSPVILSPVAAREPKCRESARKTLVLKWGIQSFHSSNEFRLASFPGVRVWIRVTPLIANDYEYHDAYKIKNIVQNKCNFLQFEKWCHDFGSSCSSKL